MSFVDSLANYVHVIVHYFLPLVTFVSIVIYFALIPETKKRQIYHWHLISYGIIILLMLLCCLVEFRDLLQIESWFHGSVFKEQICDPYVLMACSLAFTGVSAVYTLQFNDTLTNDRLSNIGIQGMAIPLVCVNLILMILWFFHSGRSINIAIICIILLGSVGAPFLGFLCYAAGEKCPHCNYYASHKELKHEEKVVKDNDYETVTHIYTENECIHCGKMFSNQYNNTEKKDKGVVYYV